MYGAKETIGVAVVGAGYWGRNLVRSFHQLGALRVICEPDTALHQRFQQQYPGILIADNLDMVLHSDVDAIVVATPAPTHYEIARAALNAGKHTFVEKPLVLDRAQGLELRDLSRRRHLTLMVGHLLRYHPAFLKLESLTANGALGRVRYIYSNRLNFGKIRTEENILWSFAPHDISMILALAGEMPEHVSSIGGNYLHPQVADVTTTHFTFSSGLRAHIFVSWLHPNKEQKLVVVGDKAMAVFDDTQPWERKLAIYAHDIEWNNRVPVPRRAEADYIHLAEMEPLLSECTHFLDCIANKNVPTTDAEEGLRVLDILQANQESLNRSGLPIPLVAPSKRSTIHPTAIIDDNVELGTDVRIWHFSHILSGSSIGDGTSIGQNVVVGPDVSIGRGCKIQNNVSVYKGVTLADGVFCGPSMVFTNVFNPRASVRRMDQLKPTYVGRGASIGANATIVCGNRIGSFALVGAGAVVTHDVPDHALVVGNPARQIGWMCECGGKLDDQLSCNECDKNYTGQLAVLAVD